MNLEQQVQQIEQEVMAFEAGKNGSAEDFRLRFLSRKGAIPTLFDAFREASSDEKKKLGKVLNGLKQVAEEKFKTLSEQAEGAAASTDVPDLTLPVAQDHIGNMHPLTLTRYRIIEIFERLGFNVEDGPEVEDDWHNISALNFPENHPAREMQDT
ncbi:MAG: phenylalanine--tRNA ligase subunit alpha, partial [Cyclobacteriaceae bacterium]